MLRNVQELIIKAKVLAEKHSISNILFLMKHTLYKKRENFLKDTLHLSEEDVIKAFY